ncbi:Putative Beta-1,4-xylosidase [Aspergillus calidoustus]|uniref:Putative Beta-1,4-xylosidase n=1 Tax=Aspergillus calidoustus TaxID=454130 RepID=A0A0U5G9A3_ASPCI|nr:Putative Beta-1,4-xylosidase [Aspergillus calidoustus]
MSPPAPKPLITHLYTADPSAHVFNNKLYIYPSHDRETDIQFNDNGDQYDMADYHVFSLSTPPSTENNHQPEVTDHGVVLSTPDVPWVSKQLWAPDAAERNGKFYLFFPARDRQDVFRIGVAVGDRPEGPFVAEKEPIKGVYSIDPAVFVDTPENGGDGDGKAAYIYFGGLWGGQLQCWTKGASAEEGEGGWVFDASKKGPQEPSGAGISALFPRVAKLTPDMLSLASPVLDLVILDPDTQQPIAADDHSRRFFEAAWMHKHNGKYYFSYSTGDTHYLVYAVSDSPLGPFVYKGRILEPVLGWTTHHSIAEWKGKWWLFYHDCEISKGVSHLRNVKMREIRHDEEGFIRLVE